MDITNTIQLLKRQVKEVPWKRMHPAFHVNTKFCHLLRAWERVLPEQEQLFTSWTEEASKFVACLPLRYRATDGLSLVEVDPFYNLRRIFASNRYGTPDLIPHVVEEMMAIANTAGLLFTQDHENLVELACSSGLITREQEAGYFLRRGRQTPREAISEMVEDMNAESAMGLGEVTGDEHTTWLKATQPSGGIEQTSDGTHLVMNGYGGCLCRFPLVIKDEHIMVLQPREHQGTSVTNLAEAIYHTLASAFPGKRVHEAYEYNFDEGKDYISEITLDQNGHAQWSFTEEPELANLIRARLAIAGPEI